MQCIIKKNKEGITPIHDCSDENLKKIFYQYGFKEDGIYESYPIQSKISNKVGRTLISSGNLTTD